MKVNKLGVDWTILRAEIMGRLEDCITALEHGQPETSTYQTRGEIAALRGIIGFVEDPEPPIVEDANYVG